MDQLEEDSKGDVMKCDVTKRDVTNEKGKEDSNGDVNKDSNKRDETNLFKHDFKIPFHTSDDTYRVDNTPGIHDPWWRIRSGCYPGTNRGSGAHNKELLNKMREGDERDQELMQVLDNVINKETSEVDNIIDEKLENGDKMKMKTMMIMMMIMVIMT